MNYETLTSDIKENIAYITLNRPERLNSFDMKLGEELYDVLRDINTRSEIRVVIIKGTGKGFCGGGDVKKMYMAELIEGDTSNSAYPVYYATEIGVHAITNINQQSRKIGRAS